MMAAPSCFGSSMAPWQQLSASLMQQQALGLTLHLHSSSSSRAHARRQMWEVEQGHHRLLLVVVEPQLLVLVLLRRLLVVLVVVVVALQPSSHTRRSAGRLCGSSCLITSRRMRGRCRSL